MQITMTQSWRDKECVSVQLYGNQRQCGKKRSRLQKSFENTPIRMTDHGQFLAKIEPFYFRSVLQSEQATCKDVSKDDSMSAKAASAMMTKNSMTPK